MEASHGPLEVKERPNHDNTKRDDGCKTICRPHGRSEKCKYGDHDKLTQKELATTEPRNRAMHYSMT